MTKIRSFEEFEVWKASRVIVREIYHLSKRESFTHDYGLKDQIRRASISIMSNIAEGYESQTENVFIRHLGIAKGSCGEVRSQLYVALDQQYITMAEFVSLLELCQKTARQLSSLLEYLKQSR
jgi:four helix bundle protein